MAWVKSREFAIALASAVITYLFVEYFFTLPKAFAVLTENLKDLGIVISAFAGVLATINILLIHIQRIRRKDTGWIYSICLLGIFLFVLIMGLTLGPSYPIYMWLQKNIYTPTSAAVWGIMGFYYVAACYTVFRVRNIDALVLFISALIIVLHNAPAVVAVWPPIHKIAAWVQDIPGTSGIRGCYITVGVGLIALAVRVILLIEKEVFVE